MEFNKALLKKWQFWVGLVAILFVGSAAIAGLMEGNNSQESENTTKTQQQKASVKYTVVGESLGEYGKAIVLNKNSDTPITKYLYKLPAGTYKVSTTFKKMASFFVVKDQVKINSENQEYPEELDYVGSSYLLTAGDDDFNGKAKKEVKITLKEDESIQIIGTEEFVFEKE